MTILIIEGVLALIFPLEKNLQKALVLGDYGVFIKEPGIEYIYSTEEYSNVVKINSNGLRDYEYTKERTSNKYRIAMVGDSVIEGYHVKLEKTIPKLLENRLNKEGNYEVINFGFTGYGLIPLAVLIEEEISDYNPDAIILNYYIGNDLNKIASGTFNKFPYDFWDKNKHESLKKELYKKDRITMLKSFIKRNSMIHYFIRKNFIFESEKEGSISGNEIYMEEYGNYISGNVVVTHSIMSFLKEFADERGIEFFVVLVPAREQVNPEPQIEGYDIEKPQKILRRILESSEINYVDILQELREIKEEIYFKNDDHFNERGNEEATKLIHDAFMVSIDSDKMLKIKNLSDQNSKIKH